MIIMFHYNDLPLFQRSILNEFPTKDKFDYITIDEIKLVHECITKNLQNSKLVMTQLDIIKAKLLFLKLKIPLYQI